MNGVDSCEWNFLHYACGNSNLEIIDLLLCKGMDRNIQDCDGDTPFRLIIRNTETNYEIIEKMLSFGADCNVQDKKEKLLSTIL